MSEKYTTAVAIAGNAVAKAADAHMRSLRGLLQSGAIDLTGDESTCELLAHGMERLEVAIATYKAVVAGK